MMLYVLLYLFTEMSPFEDGSLRNAKRICERIDLTKIEVESEMCCAKNKILLWVDAVDTSQSD